MRGTGSEREGRKGGADDLLIIRASNVSTRGNTFTTFCIKELGSNGD